MNGQLARTIAANIDTIGWYSQDRYTSTVAIVKALSERGYTSREIEAIIRSKYTRWAADCAKNPNHATAQDLMNWMDDPKNRVTKRAIAELVKETFCEEETDMQDGEPS